MTAVCFYFQVHQPFRLNWYKPENSRNFSGNLEDLYFDKGLNEFTFRKVAGKCYHRANDIILSQIDRFKGHNRDFKVSFSLSGTFLDQCERWDKDLLEKFKQMAKSGCVDFLCETYYHSLSSLYEDRTEFVEQVNQHRQTIKDLLGYTPKVFRNTELLYHNEIAKEVEGMGFKAIMTEGIERILDGWRSPNYIYKRKGGDIKVLLRNYGLSDDIGYRFSSRWWSEYPLTADKYAAWLSATPGTTTNIFIDYETFGEHHWEDTGIFWFLGALPQEILKWENLYFATPSEVVERYPSVGEIDVPYHQTVSWADLERDASAWLGNHMQQVAFSEIKGLEKLVKESKNPELLRIWRYLQTGDHFYYMCTKCLADGDVHKYFSHHGNPHDAGINYMAILSDFKARLLRYMHEQKAKDTTEEKIPSKTPEQKISYEEKAEAKPSIKPVFESKPNEPLVIKPKVQSKIEQSTAISPKTEIKPSLKPAVQTPSMLKPPVQAKPAPSNITYAKTEIKPAVKSVVQIPSILRPSLDQNQALPKAHEQKQTTLVPKYDFYKSKPQTRTEDLDTIILRPQKPQATPGKEQAYKDGDKVSYTPVTPETARHPAKPPEIEKTQRIDTGDSVIIKGKQAGTAPQENLIRVKKYAPGYTPKEGEVIIGDPKSQKAPSSVESFKNSNIIRGTKVTSEQKYGNPAVIQEKNIIIRPGVTPGHKVSPEEKYAHAPAAQPSKPAPLQSGVKPGYKVTAEEKYAHAKIEPAKKPDLKPGVNPGYKITPEQKYSGAKEPETKFKEDVQLSKNSAIIHGKKANPQDKYKPKDR